MWRTNFALAAETPRRHNAIMAEKHPKRPRDLNQWAKRMVDIATGDAEDTPTESAKQARAKGRRGGRSGGIASLKEALKHYDADEA